MKVIGMHRKKSRPESCLQVPVTSKVKPARSDPVRRKKFRWNPIGKLSDSDGDPNKIRSNPMEFHRILSDSDDIRTGIRPRIECPGFRCIPAGSSVFSASFV